MLFRKLLTRYLDRLSCEFLWSRWRRRVNRRGEYGTLKCGGQAANAAALRSALPAFVQRHLPLSTLRLPTGELLLEIACCLLQVRYVLRNTSSICSPQVMTGFSAVIGS